MFTCRNFFNFSYMRANSIFTDKLINIKFKTSDAFYENESYYVKQKLERNLLSVK